MGIGVFTPVGTHIGSTVVQDDITFLSLDFLSELFVAGRGGDIALEAGGSWYFFDGIEIDSDNGGVHGHAFSSHLHPSSWGCAKIDENIGSGEEVVLAIELDELVGSSGTVALLLSEVVVGV